MKYAYEIKPRPVELGAGWKLTLLEDGLEVGGGVFPVATEDPPTSNEWWSELSVEERSHWLTMSASPSPASARHAYLLAEAYNDAQDEADAWMDGRAQ